MIAFCKRNTNETKHLNPCPSKSAAAFFVTNNLVRDNRDARLIKRKETDGTYTDFKTDKEREDYIAEHFSSLYRENEIYVGNIQEFLGVEGINIMRDSKLLVDNDQKEFFEKDITLEELYTSIKTANLNSAGGGDGYKYQFIIKLNMYH